MTRADLVLACQAAAQALDDWVLHTPVLTSPALAGPARQLLLKLENRQRTGSFKLRGATYKLLCLSEEERSRGVVTASSGNHGLAVAEACRALGCPCQVFVPEGASSSKTAAIEALGARLSIHGNDCAQTEGAARAVAERDGLPYISPYNDLQVIAGQGTVGTELLRQSEALDAVFVAVGGGGLISGIGAVLKAAHPTLELVACSPERSAAMHHSLQAKRIVDVPTQETLSDGTAGGLEAGAITFELCRELIDRSVLVSEEAIAEAMRCILDEHDMIVEGAAGVAVAGWMACRSEYADKHVAIILCGGNVSVDTLRTVLSPDA